MRILRGSPVAKILLCLTGAGICVTLVSLRAEAPPPASTEKKEIPLAWEPERPQLLAAAGDRSVEGALTLRNKSATPVAILAVHTSCGCTTTKLGKLPTEPLVLPPGATASLQILVDLTHKFGAFRKFVTLETDRGVFQIQVEVDRAESGAMGAEQARERNQQLALADRQAVFRGTCAGCHTPPPAATIEKRFEQLCGICHASPARAAAVPALTPGTPTDQAHWEKWIREGKAGTMMPAFSRAEGGPLTEEEIAALARYLAQPSAAK